MAWVFWALGVYCVFMSLVVMIVKPEQKPYQIRGGIYFIGTIISVGIASILWALD